MGGSSDDALRRFEARLQEQATAPYVLRLFVTGASEMSGRAINNVRALCEQHLKGRYTLEVVDVHRDASLMSEYDVVAAPTLIKELPLPKRMLVGDLSDTVRVLAVLGISASASVPGATPMAPPDTGVVAD
jgi:circadian clock protein KaiB